MPSLEATAKFLTALVAIVGGVYRFLWQPAATHFRKVHESFSALEQVRKELTPNGGKSLKDQVTHISLEQKASSQSVLRLQGLVLSILSVSNSGVMLCDPNGKVEWVNGWFAQHVGWMPHELHGSGWKNLVCADDRERVYAEWKDSLAEGRDFISEFSYVTKGGELLRVSVKCEPIRSSTDRSVVGYVGFVNLVL